MTLEPKDGLFARILVAFGHGGKKRPATTNKRMSVSQCIKRVGDIERKAMELEHVTMSWSVGDLSEEEQRAMGLIE